jgi:excinuclease ABC subunit A
MQMLKSSARGAIRLRGVRHNNLKNFDLDLPLNQLVVVTGLSGSGKSSLAFDTLFAEGQRRYIETFSPYARQFFDRMDKPQVDSIEGIPPAIAIEQRNAVKTTRSTVGTMTEICEYMKMLWPHIAQLHCRQCGRPVRKDSPQSIWENLLPRNSNQKAQGTEPSSLAPPDNSQNEVLITFDLPLTDKLPLDDCLALVSKQGYQRVLLEGQLVRVDEVGSRIRENEPPLPSPPLQRRRGNRSTRTRLGTEPQQGNEDASEGPLNKVQHLASLTVVQDRLKLSTATRPRFIEACEQAYHFGKGKLTIWELRPPSSILNPRPFSNRLHCAQCDIEYREPSPALFSFNNPVGACPTCRGFGRVISIDYNLALPDRSRTLAQGVVKPWLTGHGLESQRDLMRACRHFEIPTDVPFEKLAKKWQTFVVEGDPEYGKDEEHQWPRAWYGVKGYFRWLESKAYKMHVRVLLSRYRAYTPCPDCKGKRFQPETLLYRLVTPSDTTSTNSTKTSALASLNVRAVSPSPPLQERVGERRPSLPSERAAAPTREEEQSPYVDCYKGITLADFYLLPIRDALELVRGLARSPKRHLNDPIDLVLTEVCARLGYLYEVGLGYLTLDRPTRSLSGGETERVNLTTCLGTRLVNTLFVLDEPSVGLHPRDTQRLVRILEQLRDAGNTVVVVEHEASVMRAANQIIDLGPGHGATGGQIVFQGSYPDILKANGTLTGEYLSGRRQILPPEPRPVALVTKSSSFSRSTDYSLRTELLALNDSRVPFNQQSEQPPVLKLSRASRNNLKDLTVEIPLKRFVCVTGVSGSGKTTLIREVLLPALSDMLKPSGQSVKASDRLGQNGDDEDGSDADQSSNQNAEVQGWEHLDHVELVDQSILGKTPRSNPAVYIGAFDDIRELFAQSDLARQRGLNASAFSFNSSQGQCERCRGAGFEKIEMQFLSDVFVRCPSCDGRRYRSHILEIKISPEQSPRSKVQGPKSARSEGKIARAKCVEAPVTFYVSRFTPQPFSIADLLDSTVDEAIAFLTAFPDSRPAQRAAASLRLLQDVGLGYLKLGQPINTLSGGESQRLKLVRHLADSNLNESTAGGKTLFLFDEPTTGLHFDDVRLLLKVFQGLVDTGHSVVVIEHNLDVIKCADWVIDLGPDAGDQGGTIVAQGRPKDIANCDESHTGQALNEVLRPPRRTKTPVECR